MIVESGVKGCSVPGRWIVIMHRVGWSEFFQWTFLWCFSHHTRFHSFIETSGSFLIYLSFQISCQSAAHTIKKKKLGRHLPPACLVSLTDVVKENISGAIFHFSIHLFLNWMYGLKAVIVLLLETTTVQGYLFVKLGSVVWQVDSATDSKFWALGFESRWQCHPKKKKQICPNLPWGYVVHMAWFFGAFYSIEEEQYCVQLKIQSVHNCHCCILS